MKFKEFRKLCYDQANNQLRKPNCLTNLTEVQINQKFAITNIIKNFMAWSCDFDHMCEAASLQKSLTKYYGMTGYGTLNDPFTLKTDFGSGYMVYSNCLLDKKISSFFTKQHSHCNSYEFAKRYPQHCEILSGIAFREIPFLHTVILIGDYVIDYNYDLAMSRELYLKLFNFEILNRIDGDDIKRNTHLFNKKNSFFKNNLITYGDIVFCYYEILNYMNKEKNNQQTF